MNAKKIIAGLVLADFVALNLYALYAAGLGGLADFITNLGPWGYVVVADLLIALGMVVVWMWSDAKRHGRNPFGYTLLSLATGSVGPLLYVVAGTGDEDAVRVSDAEMLAS